MKRSLSEVLSNRRVLREFPPPFSRVCPGGAGFVWWGLRRVGWHGMACLSWSGLGCDGVVWSGLGSDGMGWSGVEWGWMGWDRKGMGMTFHLCESPPLLLPHCYLLNHQ